MNIPDISVFQLARAARGLLIGDPVPLFASLEVTLRCNADCAYCGSNAAAFSGDDELRTSEWNAIIDDLADSGCFGVSLTGGEPLLRTDVEALACHAASRHLGVELNTNGRLLARRRSILKYLSGVTVSLDGVESVNDRIRGRGAFEGAVSAIRTARHAGVPVSVTTVLSAAAIDGLDDFLLFAGDMDLAVMFQPQYPSRLRSHDGGAPAGPGPSAMRDAFTKIRAAAGRGLKLRNSAAGLDILERSFAGDDQCLTCPGGRFFTRITSSGAMEICGLANDPCVTGRTASPDAREGVVSGMKRIGWPNTCGSCLSAARADLCPIFSRGPGACGRG